MTTKFAEYDPTSGIYPHYYLIEDDWGEEMVRRWAELETHTIFMFVNDEDTN